MNSMPLDQNQEIHNSTTDYLQSIYEHLVQKLQPELRTPDQVRMSSFIARFHLVSIQYEKK